MSLATSFRIQSDEFGGEWSAARVPLSVPLSIRALVAPSSGVGSGQVRLTWVAPTSNGGSTINAYAVQRRWRSDAWVTVATLPGSARSYLSSGMANGSAYQFRVLARNGFGLGRRVASFGRLRDGSLGCRPA